MRPSFRVMDVFSVVSLFVFGVCGLVAMAFYSAHEPLSQPFAGDSLVEVEERYTISTSTPAQVCTDYGGDLRSWSCVLEEAESDQIIFRGGPGVTSVDGVQYCSACRSGQVISGDSRGAWLVSTSGTPAVRCICGYR